MLKHRHAMYGIGRRKQEGLGGGTWWKWKIEPYSVDAMLVYAQPGHGRRASLYTDYTFAVWNRPPQDAAEARRRWTPVAERAAGRSEGLPFVPFAKAYSGLSDEEFVEVDRVVRRTTLENSDRCAA